MATKEDRRQAKQTYCTETTTARNMARSISSIIQASVNVDFRRACLHIIRQWHLDTPGKSPVETRSRRSSERLQKRKFGSETRNDRKADAPSQSSSTATDNDSTWTETQRPDMKRNDLKHINMTIRQQVMRELHGGLIGN